MRVNTCSWSCVQTLIEHVRIAPNITRSSNMFEMTTNMVMHYPGPLKHKILMYVHHTLSACWRIRTILCTICCRHRLSILEITVCQRRTRPSIIFWMWLPRGRKSLSLSRTSQTTTTRPNQMAVDKICSYMLLRNCFFHASFLNASFSQRRHTRSFD